MRVTVRGGPYPDPSCSVLNVQKYSVAGKAGPGSDRPGTSGWRGRWPPCPLRGDPLDLRGEGLVIRGQQGLLRSRWHLLQGAPHSLVCT